MLLGAGAWVVWEHGSEGREATPVEGATEPDPARVRPVLEVAPRPVSAPRPNDLDGQANAEAGAILRALPDADRLTLTVVDIADGERVAGVRVGWTVLRNEAEHLFTVGNSVSDRRGRVEVPRGDVSRLLVTSPDWSLVVRTGADVIGDGRLEVTRLYEVDVVVSAAPDSPRTLDPTTAEVVIDLLPLDERPWLAGRRLPRRWQGTPDAAGRTTLTAAWGRGWTVKARAPGWLAGAVKPDRPARGASRAEVRLVLHPVPRMRSQVLDPSGRPVFGADVEIFAKVEFASLAEAERAAALEFADSGRGTKERPDGRGVLLLAQHARPDREGRFEVDLPQRGEVTLVTKAPGFLMDVRRLDLDAIDLEAPIRLARPARPDERVPVTMDGKPVVGRTLFVIDRTDPDHDIPRQLEMVDGALLAEDLVRDHDYVFLLEHRRLRWDGRERIEMNDLDHFHRFPFDR
jgi:hypothetical protein